MRTAFAAAAALLLMANASDTKDGFDAWYRGDYHRAVAVWRPAAKAGDADAQFNLGQAYTLGRGVPLDIALAEGWFRRAALQGHVQAEAKYGLVLFDRGKRAEAAPWLDKAAHRGEPRAELVLGTMLFNGDGVAKDWPRAYALIVRAVAQQTPRAAGVQAQMDGYIPAEQRQQGLVLARQYEEEAARARLPFESAGTVAAPIVGNADPTPSRGVSAVEPVDPVTGRGKPGGYSRAKPGVPRPIAPSDPVAGAARGGAWRVQLGAFGDPANARKLWARVGARFAGREPMYVKSGAVTRVLVGGYASSGEAARACRSLKPCVPVAN